MYAIKRENKSVLFYRLHILSILHAFARVQQFWLAFLFDKTDMEQCAMTEGKTTNDEDLKFIVC